MPVVSVSDNENLSSYKESHQQLKFHSAIVIREQVKEGNEHEELKDMDQDRQSANSDAIFNFQKLKVISQQHGLTNNEKSSFLDATPVNLEEASSESSSELSVESHGENQSTSGSGEEEKQ